MKYTEIIFALLAAMLFGMLLCVFLERYEWFRSLLFPLYMLFGPPFNPPC